MVYLRYKKGQTGGGAGTLVAIITLLIVLYILFLPADVRNEILEGNESDDGDAPSIEGTKVLLLENPGTLEELNVLEYEHTIPSVNLFTTTGAKVIKNVNSIYIKNGVFDQKFEEVEFSADDLETTENFLLSFIAKKYKGRLIILLNGNEILNTEIAKMNVNPIELEKSDLAEENVLEFRVSGVGLKFWSTNEYVLEKVMITADVTDVSEQESRNTFLVSTTEKHNLEKAKLTFFPDCVPGQVGVLDVFVNGHNIFSAVPDCGVMRPIEFSPDYLRAGENNVVFKTRKGRYLIDQISIDTELEDIRYPTYYFDVSDEEFDDLLAGDLDVNLTLRFIDGQELKKARIYINGHTTSLNTRNDFYSRKINNYVLDGSNGIKIEPDDTTLEIIELKVVLVE